MVRNVFRKGLLFMQLLKRKKIEKQINQIKQVNHSCYDFMEHLKDKYSFTDDELENIRIMQTHLLNLNVIFSNMNKQVMKN
jgi:hypothetical protein